MIIAGIGSRETPKDILHQMQLIGKFCFAHGITIRSGHADGADWAFEQGAQSKCIAYLPWKGFNSHLISDAHSVIIVENSRYDSITAQFHPNVSKLSFGAKLLMNRNACQVLGLNLDKPADLIVAWTKDGKASGGTGQAIRIAEHYKIPVYNMYFNQYNSADKICRMLINFK